MKIVNLGSGSKGNCTVVKTETTTILIDAGLSLADIEDRLSLIEIDPHKVNAILVTHEHSDHIKSVGKLSNNRPTFLPLFPTCKKFGCLSLPDAALYVCTVLCYRL